MPVRSKRSSPRRSTTVSAPLLGVLFLSLLTTVVALAYAATSTKVVHTPTPVVVGQFDSVSVPVPLAQIPAGARLEDVEFKQVQFPKHQVPPEALTDILPYLKWRTKTALPASLPLFAANLSADALTGNRVVESIPPGMRAMTVRVDETTSVEGWAGSGSIVDVLLVTDDKTTVIAEKVKILSVERSMAPMETSDTPTVPTTATLLVTQEQCLAINTAVPLGKIAFTLRGRDDVEGWYRRHYNADFLGDGAGSMEKPKVGGYATIKGSGKSDKKFALVDGKWQSIAQDTTQAITQITTRTTSLENTPAPSLDASIEERTDE